MSELRQRMNNAMVLRGFAERTKESYLACVSGLAKYYRCSPDTLDAAAIQTYLLHLITEKKLAYASVNQAACAIRFLFGEVLRQPAIWFEIPMAKVPTRLPLILSRDEITRLFAHCKNLRDRTLLETVLRHRITPLGSLRSGTLRHRVGARPDVHQSPPGQGCQGPLHHPLAPSARIASALLARLPTPALGLPEPGRQRSAR